MRSCPSQSIIATSVSCRVYRSLHLIRRSITLSASVDLNKHLCLSLVRSQLTYCSQQWRPCLIKDIKSLEKIQPILYFGITLQNTKLQAVIIESYYLLCTFQSYRIFCTLLNVFKIHQITSIRYILFLLRILTPGQLPKTNLGSIHVGAQK